MLDISSLQHTTTTLHLASFSLYQTLKVCNYRTALNETRMVCYCLYNQVRSICTLIALKLLQECVCVNLTQDEQLYSCLLDYSTTSE